MRLGGDKTHHVSFAELHDVAVKVSRSILWIFVPPLTLKSVINVGKDLISYLNTNLRKKTTKILSGGAYGWQAHRFWTRGTMWSLPATDLDSESEKRRVRAHPESTHSSAVRRHMLRWTAWAAPVNTQIPLL